VIENIQNINRTNGWLSIHIFFKGNIYSSECDRIILEVINTYVEKYKEKDIFKKFFFIRYSELGTHVRFRLFGNSDVLKDRGLITLEKHIENNFPSSLYIIPNSNETNKNYILQKYLPETDRYGGVHGIKIAEDFFYYSSLCSIELIKDIKERDQSSRLGKGILTMLILLQTFFERAEDASIFIKNYGINYMKPFTNNEEDLVLLSDIFNDGFNKQSDKLIRHTSAIWEALEERTSINPVLDLYSKNLYLVKNKLYELQINNLLSKNSEAIENWNTALNVIIPSYIHMMNNRLGISIKDESYLAHIIYKSLNQINKTTTE